jgi:hypothetical protein
VIASCYPGRPRATLDDGFIHDEAEVRQPPEQLITQPLANRIGASDVGRERMVAQEHEVHVVGQGCFVETLFG